MKKTFIIALALLMIVSLAPAAGIHTYSGSVSTEMQHPKPPPKPKKAKKPPKPKEPGKPKPPKSPKPARHPKAPPRPHW
ncbi:MAG: hypothetical protein WCJ26_02620 [bacterium]